jgi:formylglycine-generating enzyme required for sulfatase activity
MLADATGGVANRPDLGAGGAADAQTATPDARNTGGAPADAAAGGAGGTPPDAAAPEVCRNATREHRACAGGDQVRTCQGAVWGDWGPCEALPEGYVRVAPGQFQMGSPEDEAGREVGEVRHRVTLTRTLAVKTTEVTQAEWTAVMQSRPAAWGNCGATCPVESVSFADMKAWCNAASEAAGLPHCYDAQGAFRGLDCRGYRLPTEAEWEYFARAGSATAYHTGDCLYGVHQCGADANLDQAGWYCQNTPDDAPRPVAGREANAWGLYDVHGNVWEMTQDGFGEYPGGDRTDPIGAPAATDRLVRGGGAGSAPWKCRAATRSYFDAAVRDRYLGFRPVRTL